MRKANKSLLLKKRTLHEFRRSGGQLEYFVSLFLQGNSGFVLDTTLTDEISKLGIKLSFDIYPPE